MSSQLTGDAAMTMRLIIGNKNYSSWSFRPWIALKVARIPFEETVIPLYEAGSAERILQFSPAGKVPVLIDGDLHVWESLAILEYLAEKFPAAQLWPKDAKARAHARAVAHEMHAGFAPLRRECTMNMWHPPKKKDLSPEAAANVKRIDEIWSACRARFAADGPFLFGPFSAADAMYAPVVSRFHTYMVEVGAAARAYMTTMMALPAWNEWFKAALQEPWVMAHNEPDWPNVVRLS
jgi:glutathione S-transferase